MMDILKAIWSYIWPILLIRGLAMIGSLLSLEVTDTLWVIWGYVWPILLIKGVELLVGLLFAPDLARKVKIVIAICLAMLRLGKKLHDGYYNW